MWILPDESLSDEELMREHGATLFLKRSLLSSVVATKNKGKHIKCKLDPCVLRNISTNNGCGYKFVNPAHGGKPSSISP